MKTLQLLMSAVCFSAFSAFSQTQLVAHYPLDGNGNETVADTSLALIGAAGAADRNGNDDGAVFFDGIDDYINAGPILNEVFTADSGKFSFSFWINPSDLSGTRVLFGKYDPDAGKRQFTANIMDGKVKFGFFPTLNWNPYGNGQTVDAVLEVGTWTHIAITYDGSIETENGLNRVQIFVDGVAQELEFIPASQPTTSNFDYALDSVNIDFGIGNVIKSSGLPNSKYKYYAGAMDAFKIYEGMLSQSEIMDDIQASTQTNILLADYPFNGNTEDETGNGNTCTNKGAELVADRFGNENSAYYFDGVEDFMQIDPESPEFAEMGDYSVSFWYKFDQWDSVDHFPSNNAERNYIFNGSGGTPTETFGFSSEGSSYALDRMDNGTEKLFSYSLVTYTNTQSGYIERANTQEWTHAAIVRTGDSTALFVNGELQSLTYTRDALSDDTVYMMHELYLGTFSGNNPNYSSQSYNFNGAIDDVQIWGNALSAEFVADLYGEAPELVISAMSSTNASNYNEADGTASITVAQGVEPYTYIWNNGAETAAIGGLLQGDYSVTVTDAQGTEVTETVTVGYDYETLQLSADVTDESAYGAADGAIDLMVMFGAEPYMFSWSNGENTEDLTGLAPNEYTVTITDAVGKQIIDTYTIVPAEQLTNILLADYPFNGNTEDATGNGNTCTNNGAELVADRFGNENSAYYFDGDEDFMQIDPVSAEFAEMGDYSISFWYKFDQWEDVDNFTSASSSNSERFYLFNGSGGTPTETSGFSSEGCSYVLDRMDNGTEKLLYLTKFNSFDNQSGYADRANTPEWVHTVMVRTGDSTALFINGELQSLTYTKNGTSTDAMDMMHELYLGTFSGNNPNYNYSCYNFKGTIDDVQIWGIALGTDTIAEMAADITEQPLIAVASVTNETVTGAADGAIDLSVYGGAVPYEYNWSSGADTGDISALTGSVYTVTITDAKGNETVESFTVATDNDITMHSISGMLTIAGSTVSNAPVVVFEIDMNDLLIAVDTVYTNDDGIFTADMLLPAMYVLYSPYSEINAGFADTYYYATTDVSEAEVLDLTEGDVVDIEFAVVAAVTSADENSKALVLYPNPATDIVTVSGPVTSVQIINTTGSIVLTADDNTIDVSTLPQGYYAVQAIVDGAVQLFDLVVE